MLEALIPLGASFISGMFGRSGQKAANETNINLGREQMAFQERMSNTAYPRAVQGMKDAGLNPMLAYSQGGASSPVGSMPQVQNVNQAGVASASQGAQTFSAVQQMLQSKVQTEQIAAMTKKIESETLEQNLHSAKLAAEIKSLKIGAFKGEEEGVKTRFEGQRVHEQLRAEMGVAGTDHSAFAADVRRRKADATLTELGIAESKSSSQFYEGLGQANPYLKMIVDLVRMMRGSSNLIRR